MLAHDVANLGRSPGLFALVYGTANLLLGILAEVDCIILQSRLAIVIEYLAAGNGIIMQPYALALVLICSTLLPDKVGADLLEKAYRLLGALKQSKLTTYMPCLSNS